MVKQFKPVRIFLEKKKQQKKNKQTIITEK